MFTETWFEKIKVQMAGIRKSLPGNKLLKLRVGCKSGRVKEFNSIGGVADQGIEFRGTEDQNRIVCIMPFSVIEFVELVAEVREEELGVSMIGFGLPKETDRSS